MTKGKDIFIVDNSDDLWKVENYLREWTEIAKMFDIATGYFEIGSLLSLDQNWQKLDQIRILMGDEVNRRTTQALLEGIENIKSTLDHSIENEKLDNDFLEGVPAIIDAIGSEQIKCRIYNNKKFHAKAYITHGKQEVVGSVALVGSSNFTKPGLSQNVELNVKISREVDQLQDWFEKHWNKAEDISPELLKVIDRHTREYSPFEIYVKALQEFFKAHELTENEWEKSKSVMYSVLDQYQREGYHSLLKIVKKHRGSFLCDGVGLGKTFIGLMLIERLIQFDRKRVALFVPKSVRKTWERELNKYLPELFGDFSNLAIFNHTDLNREGEFPDRLQKIRGQADVVIIDEAQDIKPEAWYEVIRPTLSDKYTMGSALFLGTPKGYGNWTYELYSKKDPEWESFKFTTVEGGQVTQEEIDQAKNDLDERTFQQEYLATFVNYAGVIYYNFDRNKHIIDTYEQKELPLHIGMDFNYNPMACCIGQIRDNNLIIFDEIQIYNANTNDMIDEIKARYGVRNIVIYPDPAARQRKTSAGGSTDLSLLRNAGFNVKVRPTHPQVRDRINAVNSKLKNANGVSSLFITKSCKNLIKSLERQIYKEGTHIPDKDSGYDHMADAIGYLIEYVFPLRRNFKPSEPTRWS